MENKQADKAHDNFRWWTGVHRVSGAIASMFLIAAFFFMNAWPLIPGAVAVLVWVFADSQRAEWHNKYIEESTRG